jgi:shikimate dehydrogenase
VTTTAVRRCAVLGSPIAHSLSPVLHRAAYAEVGLDWTYDAFEVREGDLARFLADLGPEWRGLSLTMPLKREAIALADEVSDRARTAGAANTLLREGGRVLVDNTDISGAAAALTERLAGHPAGAPPDAGTAAAPGSVESVVVLGGGATATSVLLALTELGCRRATLMVREPARASETVAAVASHPRAPHVEVVRLGEQTAPADLLVSTVPAAAQQNLLDLVDRVPAVFDVVYDPWPTPLTARARAGGLRVVTGLDLLVHQAADQFRLMTSLPEAPLSVMRAAGERAVTARSGRRG